VANCAGDNSPLSCGVLIRESSLAKNARVAQPEQAERRQAQDVLRAYSYNVDVASTMISARR
jgi:hypothetical protein